MSDLWGNSDEAAKPAQPSQDFTAVSHPVIEGNAYRVLARKYRPETFSQLIGQESMVRTLANSIEAGRIPQAWMLTGVRGIGKTTTARIIARALNCTGEDGKGGPTITPCGKCDACRSISEDRHVDVQELDAASRTGVGDIREIIEGVRYGPASARYKIYILDEVHMLSTAAFNALLKTLEEPPPHVRFIFATTEIRKVPVTVLSRCQRFDLRRIESAELARLYTDVAEAEKVAVEPEAIKLIARAADGSARDGLSLLDQAIARGGEKVTEADVKDMLGLADRSHSLDLCRHLLRGKMAAALETFSLMQRAGADPLQILQDMGELVHLLTRCQAVPALAQAAELPEAERQLTVDLLDVKIPALTRAWQILLKGMAEVQSSGQPTQAAEMVLIRLAFAAELPSPADLVRQMREQAAKGGGSPPSVSGGGGSSMRASSILAVAGQAMPMAAPVPLEAAPPRAEAAAISFRELAAMFSAHREGALHAEIYCRVHPVRCEAGMLEIRVAQGAPPNLASRIGQCLTEWTGRRWLVSLTDAAGGMTLEEEDKQAELRRRDRVLSHPLSLSVIEAFPDAKLTSIKRKTIAIPSSNNEDGGDTASSAEEAIRDAEEPHEGE